MTRRAYTLVEVLIATALLSLIVTAVAVMFGFTTKRSYHGVARFAVLRVGGQTVGEIAKTVESAVSCQKVINAGTDALVCTMPLNATDADGDGFKDRFTPSRIGKRGQVHYGQGQRVWYYLAAKEGQYGVVGPYLFRAVRNDALTPSVADIDLTWSFDYGQERPKRGPISAMSVTVDAVAKTARVELRAQTALRTDSLPVNSEPSQHLSLDVTAAWRNVP